ncbi:MAG: GntR family transcriptional regulator [Trueperaceae bacterium]|nr:MAG: GntR family transcriptional regulator [Trueperaceae bacterium]
MSVDISGSSWLQQGDKLKNGDLAYLKLRHLIVSLRLEPGSTVDELYLSRLLGLGRTPIREALIRLAQEDLVSIVPRKGTLITPLNFPELREVAELRWHLESLAARWAASRITEDTQKKLTTLLADAKSGKLRHLEDWDVEVDRRFHQLVAIAAQNRQLTKALDRLYNLSVRLLYASRTQMADVSEELFDYEEILRALHDHDPEAAEKSLQAHLIDTRQKIAEGFGMLGERPSSPA